MPDRERRPAKGPGVGERRHPSMESCFELLDAAGRIHDAHLSQTIDMLRLVEDETVAAGERRPEPADDDGSRSWASVTSRE